VKKNIIAFC